MKTPSDQLFLLIKSLTPSETRYFKVYSELHTFEGYKKKYIKLFDAIRSQDEYDEPGLKRSLKNESFVKNLKKPKRYLSEAILKSLERYHSNASADIVISQRLQQIEILHKKNLHSLALTIIHTTLKKAVEEESILYILKLLSWKAEIIKLTEKINNVQTYIDTGFREEREYMAKYAENRKYYELSYQLFPLIKSQPVVGKKNFVEKIKHILKNPSLKNVNISTMPFNTIKYYFNIMSIATREIGDWKRSHKYRLETVQYFEKNSSKLQVRALPYIQAIHNLLVSLNHLRKQEEYDRFFSKAKIFIHGLPVRYRSRIVLHEYTRLVVSYMVNQQFLFNYSKVVNTSLAMEELMNDTSIVSIENKIEFYYRTFYAYFNLCDYHAALRSLNKILGIKNADILLDYIYISRALFLAVHFELGNTDLLISLSRATQKQLQKERGWLYEYEKVLFGLFGKSIHTTENNNELIEVFKDARRKLEVVCKDNREAQVIQFFDFVSWLESKIENRPFAEVVREKVEN